MMSRTPTIVQSEAKVSSLSSALMCAALIDCDTRCNKFRWLLTIPFGRPVLPDVKITQAGSSGPNSAGRQPLRAAGGKRLKRKTFAVEATGSGFCAAPSLRMIRAGRASASAGRGL